MIKKIVSLLYSIYFNLRYFPLKIAMKLPVMVLKPVRVKMNRGQMQISNPQRFNVIFGGGSPGMPHFKGVILLAPGSELRIRRRAIIAEGTTLRCDEGATISIGDNFYCNCNCYFRSSNSISFGDDCALGWNVQINTTDGHPIIHGGKPVEMSKPVSVGNHVWLTSNVILSKGASIADDSVVAQGAVVSKCFTDTNILLGGVPAKQIADKIEWKK